MKDPREGIGADGFIVTGADGTRIRPPFEGIVTEAAAACTRAGGRALHSLHVYGSVATGQARPGSSDLDLLAVIVDDAIAPQLARCGRTLSARHRDTVREVAVAIAPLREVVGDGPAGLAWRCFLRHYCVCVGGDDLRPGLHRCRPSPDLAWAFNGDVGGVLERARAQLRDAEDLSPDAVERLARGVARKLLLVAASVVSVRHGIWTTDRGTGVRLLADAHPELREPLVQALEWSQAAPTDREGLLRLVEGLGSWLVRALQETAGPTDAG